MELRVNHAGRRWPAAKVLKVGTWDWGDRGTETVELLNPQPPIFLLSTGTNKGRPWVPDLSASWMVFAALRLDLKDAVLEFVGRYGDPLAKLPGKCDTSPWPDLQRLLQMPLAAWDDTASSEGRTAFRPSAATVALQYLGESAHATELLDSCEVRVDGHRLTMTAPTLASWMLLDALDMLVRQVPIRHCDFCGHHMRAVRGARYCGKNCRSAAPIAGTVTAEETGSDSAAIAGTVTDAAAPRKRSAGEAA